MVLPQNSLHADSPATIRLVHRALGGKETVKYKWEGVTEER